MSAETGPKTSAETERGEGGVRALGLSVRSYRESEGEDRHDFGQLVLPLSGFLEIDVGGRQAPLTPGRAAFVGAGERHSQESDRPNRSLILDLDLSGMSAQTGERLAAASFLNLNPMAAKLVDYMGLAAGGQTGERAGVDVPPSSQMLRHWTPLLLDSLATGVVEPASRLDGLMARMEASPAHAWSVEDMARSVGVSVSRLHALFRERLDTTPGAALARIRLDLASRWLAQSDLAIAELAYRAGYADQSALTRAMRRAMDITPAAYRRQLQEAGPGLGKK